MPSVSAPTANIRTGVPHRGHRPVRNASSGELPIPGGVALLAGQWLDGAARAGCRPPARLLPRLLELGASAAGLRPALVEVIGPRGRWLAAHDDRWAWATGQPIDSGEAAE